PRLQWVSSSAQGPGREAASPARRGGGVRAGRAERSAARAERGEIDRRRGEARLVRAARFLDERRLTRMVEVDAVAAGAMRAASGSRAVPHLLLEGDSGPPRADERLTLDERDARLRALNREIEHGAAHADRRVRRRDDVGVLVQLARGEPEDALG